MTWKHFCLASCLIIQMIEMSVYAKAYASPLVDGSNRVAQISNGLFPIETSPSTGNSVDELFPTQPRITPMPMPTISPGIIPTPSAGNSSGNSNPSSGASNPQSPGAPSSSPQNPSTSNGNSQPRPANPGNPPSSSSVMPNSNMNPSNSGMQQQNPGVIGFRLAETKPEFRCNLFENSDVIDVLSAINTLNQAVGTVSCGNKFINVQSVQDSSKKIVDAVKLLSAYNQGSASPRPEDSTLIANNVDLAIRAMYGLATTFGNSDLFDKECSDQLNGGEIALALNDIINGLTPIALAAASITGTTAAVPYIVGGAEMTGALSSINKIVAENSIKIREVPVRRAIVENTCQFIRLDQRYKFLIKNREDQISQILQQVTSSQNLFSANVKNMSVSTNSLVTRKNELNKTSLQIENDLVAAKNQLAIDKTFIMSTSDDLKVCQMGIQMSDLMNEQNSYISTALGSVDKVVKIYGKSNIAQVNSLKVSGQIASKSLREFSTKIFDLNSDFSICAKATKSFIETIEQSASLASQMLRFAQEKLEKEIQASPDYSQMQAQLNSLNQKQIQAERITGSLDNLRQYANTFAQSEIDSELDRLRKGLFGQKLMGLNSPVMAWFDYVLDLHRGSLAKFKTGMQALRMKAYERTNSGKNDLNSSFQGILLNLKDVSKDWDDSYKLKGFDPEFLTMGSPEYNHACREMSDVWNRWVVAIDHLSAIEAFCRMIDSYIYDGRIEDRNLVKMCRGRSSPVSQFSVYAQDLQTSTLQRLKDEIIRDQLSNWALHMKQKLDALSCPKPRPNF